MLQSHQRREETQTVGEDRMAVQKRCTEGCCVHVTSQVRQDSEETLEIQMYRQVVLNPGFSLQPARNHYGIH